MIITVFELLNQFIYKKKLGSDVYIVRWSKLLWIEVFQQQNKTSWHNTLLHATHGNLLLQSTRKKGLCYAWYKFGQVTKVCKSAGGIFFSRKHEKSFATEIVEIRYCSQNLNCFEVFKLSLPVDLSSACFE